MNVEAQTIRLVALERAIVSGDVGAFDYYAAVVLIRCGSVVMSRGWFF